MSTKLSVNVNKVATLRNTRSIGIPSVVDCARLCLDAGAHGITVHPRPDARHIRPDDVAALAALLREYPHAELNIEGNPFHGVIDYVVKYRPAQCTLVPDESAQATSDHGWDLVKDAARLEPILAHLRSMGCRSSLFMDADVAGMAAARDLGADRVELYTEPYAAAFARGAAEAAVARFRETANRARAVGLGVNAGHDLNVANLGPLLAAVAADEVSIGHALIADALRFGLPSAVRQYLAVVHR